MDISYYIYSDGSVLSDIENNFRAINEELSNLIKDYVDEKLLKELLTNNNSNLTYAKGDAFFPKGVPMGESIALYKSGLFNYKRFIDKLNDKKLPINESTIKQLNLNLVTLEKFENKYNIKRGKYKNETELREYASFSKKQNNGNENNKLSTNGISKRDDRILQNPIDSRQQQRTSNTNDTTNNEFRSRQIEKEWKDLVKKANKIEKKIKRNMI